MCNPRSLVWTLTAVALLAPGCSGSVPDDHTSLALAAGKDPGPPAKKLSMVWLHHSTGDNLLAGGLRAALDQNNIAFYDINYKEAVVDGYVIGDHTDTQDFPKAFNTPKHLAVIKGWELQGDGAGHDIVMFKSCYPNSNIDSDKMLQQYKQTYLALLPTFKAHPEILFIGMSTPPLVRWHTTEENAARARKWAKWVTGEYAKDVANVQVFDLFDALAIREGKKNANRLVPQFATNKEDSHPTPAGAQAVTRLFIPWLNRVLHETGRVK